MQRFAHTVRYLATRYLATRYLADPDRADRNQSNQHIARTNAAEACATLRKRRHEREDVDAYLRARRRTRSADDTETSRGARGTGHAL